MKKLRLKIKRDAVKEEAPSRITNETVAEHRERILAGGRRFKYPMQYAKHRLVFTTILVAVAALILLIAVGWWQLYSVQSTNTFFYRVTRVLPLPVASIDGEQVRYGDYLMYYNSSAHYLQQSEQANFKSEDGRRQLDWIKRKTMDNVEAYAYATKLTRERNISIKEEQIDKVIEDDRSVLNVSQETYDASNLNVLGWSPDEYRQAVKNNLIRQAASYAIDDQAKSRQETAAGLLKQNTDLDAVAAQLGGEGDAKVTVGQSGLVPRSNRDGGLSSAALSLEKGQISNVIKTTTGDGYYFVKLLEKNDTQISYAYLKVPLTIFKERLVSLKRDGKIKEFISIPDVDIQNLNQ